MSDQNTEPQPEEKEDEVSKEQLAELSKKKSNKKPKTESPKDDPLYVELDAELKAKLGDDLYNDYKDYPIKERVGLLRSLDKSLEKAKKMKEEIEKGKEDKPKPEASNPVAPPAPHKVKPKTVLEQNNKDTYFDSLRDQTSFLSRAQGFIHPTKK